LTNEISKATFGKTVGEYKDFKGLKKPNQNLRDHMTDWELILTMVGEKATTDITFAKDAKGFSELKHTAKEGGDIAKNTRKELEKNKGQELFILEFLYDDRHQQLVRWFYRNDLKLILLILFLLEKFQLEASDP